MKRHWSVEDLSEHWTLTPDDFTVLGNKTGTTRLGFAVLLKYFHYEGRFPPARQEIPWAIVTFLAGQVSVAAEEWAAYRLDGRTATYHRTQIRQWLAYRAATARDGKALTTWLIEEVVPTEQRPEHLKEQLLQHCRAVQIEPPSEGRLQRFIDSALRHYETRLYAQTLVRLAPEVRASLDGLLTDPPYPSDPDVEAAARGDREDRAGSAAMVGAAGAPIPPPTQPDRPDAGMRADARVHAQAWTPQTFQDLRTDPGRVGLQTFLREVAKLRHIRALGLPADLFAGVAPAVVHTYRQRAEAEKPSALLAHPVERRATLLAALLIEREQEIIDNLVELLIQLMHRVVRRAEDKVEAAYVTELKRVANKGTLLFQLADAAVAHPDGTVREVIFPVVSEATLKDLVAEYKAHAPAYRQQVHAIMRSSYRTHYRQMLPQLLALLDFRSNNDAHRPVVEALRVLAEHARLLSARRDHPD